MDKLSGESFDIILYEDGVDALTDSDTLSAITTQPTGSAYATQTATFSSTDISGDWGIDNDTQISFDVSDSDRDVDAVAVIVNFQSDDAGDGAATDNLLFTASLSQTRDLSAYSGLDIAAGDLELTLT